MPGKRGRDRWKKSMKYKQRKVANFGKAWTDEQDKKLITLFRAKMEWEQIAKELGRTFKATKQRYYMLQRNDNQQNDESDSDSDTSQTVNNKNNDNDNNNNNNNMSDTMNENNNDIDEITDNESSDDEESENDESEENESDDEKENKNRKISKTLWFTKEQILSLGEGHKIDHKYIDDKFYGAVLDIIDIRNERILIKYLKGPQEGQEMAIDITKNENFHETFTEFGTMSVDISTSLQNLNVSPSMNTDVIQQPEIIPTTSSSQILRQYQTSQQINSSFLILPEIQLLQKGDKIDHQQNGTFFGAEIIAHHPGQKTIYIHYIGYGTKCNLWVQYDKPENWMNKFAKYQSKSIKINPNRITMQQYNNNHNNNNNNNHINNNNMADFNSLFLNSSQIESLRIGDRIDHKDEEGRFLPAEIIGHDQKSHHILIHYTGYDHHYDTNIDYHESENIYRKFAKFKSISMRPNTRFPTLQIGEWINCLTEMLVLNGKKKTVYQPGKVIGFDKRKNGISGQVLVDFGNKQKYWFHPDGEEEVQSIVNIKNKNPRSIPATLVPLNVRNNNGSTMINPTSFSSNNMSNQNNISNQNVISIPLSVTNVEHEQKENTSNGSNINSNQNDRNKDNVANTNNNHNHNHSLSIQENVERIDIISNPNRNHNNNNNLPPRPPLPPISSLPSTLRSLRVDHDSDSSSSSYNSINISSISARHILPRKRKRNMIENCGEIPMIDIDSDQDEETTPNRKKRKIKKAKIWDTEKVLDWFYEINYGKYVDTLRPHFECVDMDGRGLKMIDMNDLMSFGITSFLDRKLILTEIKKLIF